jgi:phosphotransferase family enzyme
VLDVVRDVLADAGVVAPGDPLPHFSARMSGNVGMLFYLASGASYLAKIGLLTRLDREYHGLEVAHRAMPSNVPEPIRLATCRGYQVLVTRGIRHSQLWPLRGAADVEIFTRGIASFMATAAQAFAGSAGANSRDGFDAALASAAARVRWHHWQAYGERVRVLASRLPPIRQHGDFAVNNIGVRDRALVFFDWEDFGEVDLAGFDLAVLLLSINDFSFAKLATKIGQPSMEADIARSGCGSLGLSVAEFLDLFGIYASLYIQTKSRLGYPTRVSDRVALALEEWIRLEPKYATA